MVQTQVWEIPSFLQIVITCILSPNNDTTFLTLVRTVQAGTLPRCFHLSTFLSFFPSLCAVVKKIPIVKSTRWSLLDNGNWSEFVSTYCVLDVVQCCFSSFCSENGRNVFHKKNVAKFSYHLTFCYKFHMLQNAGNTN